jgi:hypothetical protein
MKLISTFFIDAGKTGAYLKGGSRAGQFKRSQGTFSTNLMKNTSIHRFQPVE